MHTRTYTDKYSTNQTKNQTENPVQMHFFFPVCFSAFLLLFLWCLGVCLPLFSLSLSVNIPCCQLVWPTFFFPFLSHFLSVSNFLPLCKFVYIPSSFLFSFLSFCLSASLYSTCLTYFLCLFSILHTTCITSFPSDFQLPFFFPTSSCLTSFLFVCFPSSLSGCMYSTCL